MPDDKSNRAVCSRCATAAMLALTTAITAWAAAQQPARNAAAAPAATRPATQPARSGLPLLPRQPTADEVLRAMQRAGDKPAASQDRVIPPKSSPDVGRIELPRTITIEPVRSTGTRLLPEGYRLVDRAGRLVRNERGWMFVFEERSKAPPEAPMQLLANRFLEEMETRSQSATLPGVFIVSGDITEYHGSNYLLVQKLAIRPDLGNLK